MLHRVNRILTMAVLILLSLVLITTSVVSGIFAKYTLTRSIMMTLGFERLGISVEIELSDAFKSAGEVTNSDIQDGVQIVIKNFKMKPGDIFADAFKLTVNGSPIEAAQFVVDVDVAYSNSSFLIPAGNFDSIKTPTYYMPIGFIAGTFGNVSEGESVGEYTYNGYAVDPYSQNPADEIAKGIAEKVANLTNLEYDETQSMASMNCAANIPITFGENISAIGFGFEWPETYDTVSNSNEIGTWISNQDPAHTFDITYTIRVEQGT